MAPSMSTLVIHGDGSVSQFPKSIGAQPMFVLAAAEKDAKQKSIGEVFKTAGQKALRGGIPGLIAMGVQVGTLMWMRTAINYQYANGTSTMEALKTLYAEGGIPRFYKGVVPALIQGPLARFGDTAANEGVLALLAGNPNLPIPLKTACASAGAATFRIFLMPVDCLKTSLQVNGARALPELGAKIKAGGPGVLYAGFIATSVATWVGHFPWFTTNNYLEAKLPKAVTFKQKLIRAAFIGWCASFVSDCCSNSVRVVKTKVQTSKDPINMVQAAKMVIEKDGVVGLFTRGLGTKLICNGLQGIMFSVVWKMLMDKDAQKAKSMELPPKGTTVTKTVPVAPKVEEAPKSA